MNTSENFTMYKMALGNLLRTIAIFICEIFMFGKFGWFWVVTASFFLYYVFYSPYEVVKKARKIMNFSYNNLIYGETPFITMKHILEYAGALRQTVHGGARKDMKFCDLGSGRGSTVFFAGYYFKMNATGFDVVPYYVNTANKIKNKLRLNNIEFINSDFGLADISGFDIIYAAGTTWDDENMRKLESGLKNAKKGAVVISISRKLDYDFLNKTGEKIYPFSWGTAQVYFYVKTN